MGRLDTQIDQAVTITDPSANTRDKMAIVIAKLMLPSFLFVPAESCRRYLCFMGLLLAVTRQFQLELPDDKLLVVKEALELSFVRRTFVTICSWYPPDSCYLAVDLGRFLPGLTSESGEQLTPDKTGLAVDFLFMGPVDGKDPDAELVEQLVELMDELDGFLILDADDNFVTDLEQARKIRSSALRLPIVNLHPGH
ncbi:hypothetical protein [Corynebacterium phoceense]